LANKTRELSLQNRSESQNFVGFWERLPDDERLIVDILRQIILENLPDTCKEKFAWHVPCYYVKRMICIVWPASVPRGGIKKGVLLGFWQGYRLKNANGYIYNGTNKQIYYKVIKSVEEIDEKEIIILLKEALEIDSLF
jgi:hypothetical protein